MKSENKKNFKKKYVGIVDSNSSGNAYIITKELTNDIFVFKENINGAFNKDLVEVAIINVRNNKNYGKIIKIIKRNITEFIGTLSNNNNKLTFTPLTKYKILNQLNIINPNIIIKNNEEKVLAKIIKENKNKTPTLEVIKTIDLLTNEQDIINDILIQHNFKLDFTEEVLNFSNNFKYNLESELKHRKDFRNILTFTIDPFDAKDFDDALSYRKLENGNLEIGIHIADVSYFVKENSPIDIEAKDRCTSVYLPGFVLPMLPENISNNLCSLVPNQDRLTFSVIIEIKTNNLSFEIIKTEFNKTIINSNKRFNYEEIQDIIENKKTNEYEKIIKDLNTITQFFRKERMKNNAINFSSIELNFVLNEDKTPIDIKLKESKESHQLIEEFMLIANKKVAEFIYKTKPVVYNPYRTHDLPDEQKVINFTEFVRKFGHKFDSSNPNKLAQSINKLLEETKNTPQFFIFEKLAIRSMSKAVYSTKNIGHYGLGFEYYTHFTSPIRRYPDLLTHRILYNILSLNKNKQSLKELNEQCEKCNYKEKNAVDAERMGIKYKQVQYMKQFVGKEFNAIISGVASFGIWAETIEHRCEGIIKMSELLLIDNFIFKPEDYCLIGKKTNKILSIGDNIKILVLSANIEDKELNFKIIF